MLPRRRPGDGDTALPTWQLEKVRNGDFAAWKTGEAFWCETHYFDDASMPCRSALTNGGLECPHDHGQYPPRWLGYLPLIDESGKPICVVVQGYSLEQIEALPLGVELLVSRAKGRNKPIMVQTSGSSRKFKGFDRLKADPILFERWLLKMWCDAALALHFGVRGVTHKRGDGKRVTPATVDADHAGPRDHIVRANDPRGIGDVLNGVFKKLK